VAAVAANIGYIHRSAALRDRTFDLVAGAFDIDSEQGKDFGIQLGLDPDRCYPDYQTLFAEEAKRVDGIEAVSIATPNSTHYSIAKAALQAGLHVVVEKPMCFESKQAAELVESPLRVLNRVVGVTYGYAGHQAIEQARQMVKNGDLGEIRIIQMQFAHAGNDRLSGLFIGMHAEGRIFLRQTIECNAHLFLIDLGLRFHCLRNHRLRKYHAFQNDDVIGIRQRVARGDILETDRRGDIAGIHIL